MAHAEHMFQPYSVVWFKRDLRIADHTPLIEAAKRGLVFCIYCVEPRLWTQPDAARQHYHFIRESLQDLERNLSKLGGSLSVHYGDAELILDELYQVMPFQALYSHQETGNAASFLRDLLVKQFCKRNHIEWIETPQFGVARPLKNRDHWLAFWQQHVSALQANQPIQLSFYSHPLKQVTLPSATQLGLSVDEPRQRQRGGRQQGLIVLNDFLNERCESYRGGISSPLSAPTACSRLSPYLAHGCLSLREVMQATQLKLNQLPASAVHTRLSLQGFISRLHWHCHFIQKLETEPEIEWQNMHRGYDNLREHEWCEAHFTALKQGQTGWPLVDACVAMLRDTGWLNFRMRAMLVSVAAYPLWLHWRPVGEWLAQQFLDYEPGIHWSQLQMQSGTTGINVPRVYNPIKQAKDHDPQGMFVRRWLPAMREVPQAWLFEPWRMPDSIQQSCGVIVGQSLPFPLVDLVTATRLAKAKMLARRSDPTVKVGKFAVIERHASRKKIADLKHLKQAQLGWDWT